MGFSKVTVLSVAAMLVMSPLFANAHIILAEPVPFGNPNNSPLEPNGSDFPCKSVPYTIKTMNNWAVGSTQKLAFTGTAIHGGGSCQVSITTDKEPTKASKWKVVHSFEGGCPSAVKDNLAEGGPNSDTTFPFEVPSELPNGQLTMAWTWFNKQGNREFYMNCAPVTVSGGASDTSGFDSLPDMAIANLQVPGSCGKTEENFDYTFANPGKYKTSGGIGPFKPLCNAQAGPGDGLPASGSGPAPAPVVPQPSPAVSVSSPATSVSSSPAAPVSSSPVAPGSSSPSAPVSSQAPASQSNQAQTSTIRTVIIVTAPMGSPAPTSQAGASTPSAPASAPVAPAPTVPAPVPAPGRDTSSGTSCSPDGAVVCSSDGTQFAVCNFGSAVFQAVAPGTKCSNGIIARRDFTHRAQRTVI